jgi:hypothetical protein
VVVIGVRGDFLDRCAVYADLVPVLQDGQFIIGPMTPAELGRAITGPADAAGISIEAGLVDHGRETALPGVPTTPLGASVGPCR